MLLRAPFTSSTSRERSTARLGPHIAGARTLRRLPRPGGHWATPCQRQPRRLGDHKRVLVWNHKEEDKSTRPRRDTRVTTSTKVESSHDLMWSSGD